MAGATSNFGLIKPTYNEPVDVQNFNDNFDIIDAAMQSAKPLMSSFTISTSDWDSTTLTCTKTVAGVTADSLIFINPDSSSYNNWLSNSVKATAQAANSLSFSCSAVPSSDLVVNVTMFVNTRSS